MPSSPVLLPFAGGKGSLHKYGLSPGAVAIGASMPSSSVLLLFARGEGSLYRYGFSAEGFAIGASILIGDPSMHPSSWPGCLLWISEELVGKGGIDSQSGFDEKGFPLAATFSGASRRSSSVFSLFAGGNAILTRVLT